MVSLVQIAKGFESLVSRDRVVLGQSFVHVLRVSRAETVEDCWEFSFFSRVDTHRESAAVKYKWNGTSC